MNATPEEIGRKAALKDWMKLHRVTFVWTSKKLSVSPSAVQKWLFYVETIRPIHREALITLGFPAELLPRGEFKKSGPQPKIPTFVEVET